VYKTEAKRKYHMTSKQKEMENKRRGEETLTELVFLWGKAHTA
jgi:hypothetical protein